MIELRIPTPGDFAYERRRKITAKKLAEGKPFKDSELIYSARDLCPCGAGIAYPKGSGMNGYWDCSDILKGEAWRKSQHPGEEPHPSNYHPAKPGWDGMHTDKLPFAFYEVKSELQPLSNGEYCTTRPGKTA